MIKQEEKDTLNKAMKDLRQTHFHFGNNPLTYLSTANEMKEHQITTGDI
jgi:GH25 family lysozyme M1 (1,4-beta-N-acetylmuramidase)